MDLDRNGDALRFMDEIYRTSAGEGFLIAGKQFFEVNLPFEYTELTASYPCKICEQPQQSGVCSDAQANLKCPGNKQQC